MQSSDDEAFKRKNGEGGSVSVNKVWPFDVFELFIVIKFNDFK
jgi:hypothetical protein